MSDPFDGYPDISTYDCRHAIVRNKTEYIWELIHFDDYQPVVDFQDGWLWIVRVAHWIMCKPKKLEI